MSQCWYRHLFRKYLEAFSHSNYVDELDPRKSIIVTDPEQANAFLIDHEWIRATRNHCDTTIQDHLVPIINNVIDNYPYFNRSQGKDHFFLGYCYV